MKKIEIIINGLSSRLYFFSCLKEKEYDDSRQFLFLSLPNSNTSSSINETVGRAKRLLQNAVQKHFLDDHVTLQGLLECIKQYECKEVYVIPTRDECELSIWKEILSFLTSSGLKIIESIESSTFSRLSPSLSFCLNQWIDCVKKKDFFGFYTLVQKDFETCIDKEYDISPLSVKIDDSCTSISSAFLACPVAQLILDDICNMDTTLETTSIGEVFFKTYILNALLPHSRLQCALIIGTAAVVYNRCFNSDTMTRASLASLYIRQMLAPPVIQSLVEVGLISPSALYKDCLFILKILPDNNNHDINDDIKQIHTFSLFVKKYVNTLIIWLSQREYAKIAISLLPRLLHAPEREELLNLPWAAASSVQHSLKTSLSTPRGGSSNQALHGSTSSSAAFFNFITTSFTSSSTSTSDEDDDNLANTLRTIFESATIHSCLSIEEAKRRFFSKNSGIPLLDASIRCLDAKGFVPPFLLPLIATVWCKHLGQPWSECLQEIHSRSIGASYSLSVMQWHWMLGFCGDSSPGLYFSTPVDDFASVLHGFDPQLSPRLSTTSPTSSLSVSNSLEGLSSSSSSFSSLLILFRTKQRFPPHPHVMAHPAGTEFATQLDSGGIFIRMWLQDSLSPFLPDAYIYDPSSAPSSVLENAKQTITNTTIIVNTTSIDETNIDKIYTYSSPFTSLFKARTTVINCITKLQLAHTGSMKGVSTPSSFSSSSTSSSSFSSSFSSSSIIDKNIDLFLAARLSAGYNALWGTIEGRTLLVEEDAAVLLSTGLARAGENGWEDVAVDVLTDADPPAYIQVSAQVKSELAVRPHMASIVMTRHNSSIIKDSLDALEKYSQWDLSWATAKEISRIDPFNQVAYFVGDPPPPPFSFLFPQRDFVLFRLVMTTPRETCVVVKTGGHALFDPSLLKDYEYVRGEVVGTVGFAVRSVGTPSQSMLLTTDKDGGQVTTFSQKDKQEKIHERGFEAFLPMFWPPPPLSSRLLVNTAPPDTSSAVLIYSAGDPKGNLPSFVINAVAKRMLYKWTLRLATFCDSLKK
jgi:hypothetical protein